MSSYLVRVVTAAAFGYESNHSISLHGGGGVRPYRPQTMMATKHDLDDHNHDGQRHEL